MAPDGNSEQPLGTVHRWDAAFERGEKRGGCFYPAEQNRTSYTALSFPIDIVWFCVREHLFDRKFRYFFFLEAFPAATLGAHNFLTTILPESLRRNIKGPKQKISSFFSLCLPRINSIYI